MQYGLAKRAGKQKKREKGEKKKDKSWKKEEYFSFNIDEATNSNLHKVLTLLVSYFRATKNEVVVEHLGSQNLPTGKPETVFKTVIYCKSD